MFEARTALRNMPASSRSTPAFCICDRIAASIWSAAKGLLQPNTSRKLGAPCCAARFSTRPWVAGVTVVKW